MPDGGPQSADDDGGDQASELPARRCHTPGQDGDGDGCVTGPSTGLRRQRRRRRWRRRRRGLRPVNRASAAAVTAAAAARRRRRRAARRLPASRTGCSQTGGGDDDGGDGHGGGGDCGRRGRRPVKRAAAAASASIATKTETENISSTARDSSRRMNHKTNGAVQTLPMRFAQNWPCKQKLICAENCMVQTEIGR